MNIKDIVESAKNNYYNLNQNGGTIGYCRSILNHLVITDGNIGDISNSRYVRVNHNLLDLNGGKIFYPRYDRRHDIFN